jgi:hypothetical protein
VDSLPGYDSASKHYVATSHPNQWEPRPRGESGLSASLKPFKQPNLQPAAIEKFALGTLSERNPKFFDVRI